MVWIGVIGSACIVVSCGFLALAGIAQMVRAWPAKD